jgi:hypothetical protein
MYQIVQDNVGMYYLLSKTEDERLCTFQSRWIFVNLETLCVYIDQHFHNHKTTTFEKCFTVIDSFDTIEEFQELMCEYLI